MHPDDNEIWSIRERLSPDQWDDLGALGKRLGPRRKSDGQRAGTIVELEEWKCFLETALASWARARRAAAAVLAAPELRGIWGSLSQDVKAAWQKKHGVKNGRLNTVLALFARVASGSIGNAFRSTKLDPPDLYLRILLGSTHEMTWLRKRIPLKRKLVITKLKYPLSCSFAKWRSRVALLVINTDVADDEQIDTDESQPLHDKISMTWLGDAIKLGGYAVWLRTDDGESFPRWWLAFVSNYCSAHSSKGREPAQDLHPSGESVVIDRAEGSSHFGLRWRRVSFAKKILRVSSQADASTRIEGPAKINEVFFDVGAHFEKHALTEAKALGLLIRHCCGSRRSWVLTITTNNGFRDLMAKAARLADARLLWADPCPHEHARK